MRKPTSSLNLLPIHIEITSTSSPPCHGWGFSVFCVSPSVSLYTWRPSLHPPSRNLTPPISHPNLTPPGKRSRPSVRQLLDYPSSLLLQLNSPSSVPGFTFSLTTTLSVTTGNDNRLIIADKSPIPDDKDVRIQKNDYRLFISDYRQKPTINQ